MIAEILSNGGIPAEKTALFERYAEMIRETNQSFNLTRILSEEDMAVKHFLDSVAAAEWIPQNARVIDIGTGAGFPIVPLAILRGDIRATAVESSEKKLGFVQRVADELGLNLTCICARAEELATLHAHRESYDCCVSRAVAALPMLLELGLPFVKQGGALLAYKGAQAAEEVRSAKNAAQILGAAPAELHHAHIAGTDHCIVEYRKIKPTPEKYPRRYAQIKAKTL